VHLNQMGDPMRDHPCFSASSAGEKQQWTIHMLNGFALLRVETCKKIHEWKGGGALSE
jgi:hypothetical protein